MSSSFEHKADYEPLPAYEGEEIVRVKKSQPERTHIIHWLGQLLLFTISLVLFICGLEGRVARNSDAPRAVYCKAKARLPTPVHRLIEGLQLLQQRL